MKYNRAKWKHVRTWSSHKCMTSCQYSQEKLIMQMNWNEIYIKSCKIHIKYTPLSFVKIYVKIHSKQRYKFICSQYLWKNPATILSVTIVGMSFFHQHGCPESICFLCSPHGWCSWNNIPQSSKLIYCKVPNYGTKILVYSWKSNYSSVNLINLELTFSRTKKLECLGIKIIFCDLQLDRIQLENESTSTVLYLSEVW